MNDFNSKTQDILFGSQHESLNLISRSFKNTRDSVLDDRIYLGPEMTHNFSSKSCCIVYLLFPYWMYGIKLLYMLYLVSNLFFFKVLWFLFYVIRKLAKNNKRFKNKLNDTVSVT